MTRKVFMPVGDGDAEAVLTLRGCERYVKVAMEAAKAAVQEAVRAEYGREAPPEGRAPGRRAKPCGCGE